MTQLKSTKWARLIYLIFAFTLIANDEMMKPQIAFGQVYFKEVVIDKRCSNCGRSVPLNSHVGQRCPYCGAYWGFEVRKNVGANYINAPEPARKKVTIHYNDQVFETDCRKSNDTILVPVRFFSETLGFTVIWTPPDNISISKDDRNVLMTIGKKKVTIIENGITQEKELPFAVKTYSGRTFIPLRALTESLGFTVDYRDGEVYLYPPAT